MLGLGKRNGMDWVIYLVHAVHFIPDRILARKRGQDIQKIKIFHYGQERRVVDREEKQDGKFFRNQ